MHNPIAITRSLSDRAVGEENKPNGPTKEEVVREVERMAALHKGWLEHPITITKLRILQTDFNEKLQGLFKLHSMMSDAELRSSVAGLSSLNWVLNTLD